MPKLSVNRLISRLRLGRELVWRWFVPGEVSRAWNIWNLYREVAWYGVFAGVSNTFTSIFTLRLGGSDVLVGLLTSLPALINIVWQIPAARLIERQRNTRRLILISGFFQRLPALLLALLPVFLWHSRAAAVVCIMALGSVPTAVSNVAFTTMLASVVASSERAHVISVRRALFSAVTMVTVIAAGKVLDVLPFPVNYQLIFALAFVTSLLGLYYIGRIVIPDHDTLRLEQSQSTHPGLRHSLRVVLAHRDFVRFSLASFLYQWGLYLPIPLYAIYRVRTLRISDGWIGALAMIESGIPAVTYYVWGRLAQKRSSRFVLLLGALGVCLYPLGTALSTRVELLLLVSLIGGIVGPAFNLGIFNSLLEVIPADNRATYLALFNTLLNVAAFISPVLGTLLAGWLGIRLALVIGGIARLAGFMVYLRLLSGSWNVKAGLLATFGR